jgi:tetratricopeptide (TPR) repeat protein
MSSDKGQFTSLSGTLWSNPTPSRAPAARSAETDLAAPLPPSVGKYKVLGQVGVGAMGVVYRCSQPGLERPVAVKVMVAGRHASSEQILRFQREAWAAAQLTHPNVLQIYDVGSEGDLNYFVMEYVDGWSLDQLIGSPFLTLERSLRLLQQIARALQAAHARGIIHRDIKPSNILIHRSGQPKLADFGLAKSLDDGQNLSGCGDLIGTPRYMSPEQALAVPEEVDLRTDVYSLGAVMYEMLTGRPPVDGPNVMAILRKLTDEEPVPLRDLNPAILEEVAAICRKAMAREKEARYASAGEFAEALETYLAGRLGTPTREEGPASDRSARGWILAMGRGRWRLWAWATLAATVVFGLGTLALQHYPPSSVQPREVPVDEGPPAEGPGGEQGFIPPIAPEVAKAGRRVPPDEKEQAARVVARAREQLTGAFGRTRSATPRDRLRTLLQELSAVLTTQPDSSEARFLRAQANRRAGEYLAAIDDLNLLLQREPKNLAAVTERLLANYEVHILYLGNLNEPVLRPMRLDRVRDDAQVLAKGSPVQQYLAKLVEALARQDYTQAGQTAEAGPLPGVRADDLPDVLLVQADALFRAAEAAYAAEAATEEGPDKEQKRRRRERLAHLAHTTLRHGLDADPSHAGLLFLKADTFQRLAAWETVEGEDRATLLKRQRLAFETAMNQLRNAIMLGSCDTELARAVLLSNFGRDSAALDRVNDALSVRPSFLYLYTLKAWLRLQAPPEEVVTAEEVDRILHELQPAFETPPEDYNAYFTLALVQAAGGRWEDARRNLKTCQRKLGKDTLPTAVPVYQTWYAAANAPFTRFLDTLQDVLANLSVPVDLRVRLSEEMLRRLADAEIVKQEALKPQDIKAMKGWAHARLAKVCADKQDKAGVLRHVEGALSQQLPELTPKTFQEDGSYAAWKEDEDFRKLYKRFGGT